MKKSSTVDIAGTSDDTIDAVTAERGTITCSKAVALARIDRVLALSDESHLAMVKLAASELTRLADECEELHRGIRARALNTARCPKDPGHGPHKFTGTNCTYCKVEKAE